MLELGGEALKLIHNYKYLGLDFNEAAKVRQMHKENTTRRVDRIIPIVKWM